MEKRLSSLFNICNVCSGGVKVITVLFILKAHGKLQLREENLSYWYPLGQRKVILHDSIMTFVSVIPATVHQNLDSVTN